MHDFSTHARPPRRITGRRGSFGVKNILGQHWFDRLLTSCIGGSVCYMNGMFNEYSCNEKQFSRNICIFDEIFFSRWPNSLRRMYISSLQLIKLQILMPSVPT